MLEKNLAIPQGVGQPVRYQPPGTELKLVQAKTGYEWVDEGGMRINKVRCQHTKNLWINKGRVLLNYPSFCHNRSF